MIMGRLPPSFISSSLSFLLLFPLPVYLFFASPCKLLPFPSPSIPLPSPFSFSDSHQLFPAAILLLHVTFYFLLTFHLPIPFPTLSPFHPPLQQLFSEPSLVHFSCPSTFFSLPPSLFPFLLCLIPIFLYSFQLPCLILFQLNHVAQ